MDPATFDRLVGEIEDHPVFNSRQMPVRTQLLIVLQRFGSYGNGVSLEKVAQWGGVGEGTVDAFTRRIILAVLDSDMHNKYVRWPASEGTEREDAKQAIEDITCAEWRNGWSMIDGTLIPLYVKPHFFGEAFYDRKANYSLNVQVSSSFQSF
jgi:predicted GTPase